jgi:DNA-binding IscR family transcriptional regulator
MQITRQADYATRAILYLARHRNGELVGIITETDFCRLLMLQPEVAA